MTAQSPTGGMRKSTIPTDDRMKACRAVAGAPLDGDDAEPEHRLARRPAAHQHLAEDRVAEHDGGHADDGQDDAGRAADDHATMRSSANSAATWISASMRAGDRARGDARRLEVEHDGLGGDDAARVGGHSMATVPAATSRGVADNLPWTSTASSPATRPAGTDSSS